MRLLVLGIKVGRLERAVVRWEESHPGASEAEVPKEVRMKKLEMLHIQANTERNSELKVALVERLAGSPQQPLASPSAFFCFCFFFFFSSRRMTFSLVRFSLAFRESRGRDSLPIPGEYQIPSTRIESADFATRESNRACDDARVRVQWEQRVQQNGPYRYFIYIVHLSERRTNATSVPSQ